MNKTLKRLFGCTITILITVFVITKLGYWVRPENTDKSIKTIDTFHDMPENSIEVIGYGSSHMWRGMNSMEMYESYGIGVFNYGCNWQRINTTLLFLKDSLRTQSPKIALIDTYRVNEILSNTDVVGEIYYTRAISDFAGKRQYLKQCLGDEKERYLAYYMPLCAFHDNWINLTENNFVDTSAEEDFYKTMGFFPNDKVSSQTLPNPDNFDQWELSDSAIEILDEMVAICEENDIKIIFCTIPYKGAFYYGDAMTEYAEENGCVYLNLFEYIDEIGIDGATDFADAGHLNTSGATKIANFMGEYIVNNYDVTDMRTIEGNMWEQNAQR